ncbi:MAG: PD-(D/E)XK nuclease family protein [Cytophagales bacterium]|nr:PD-(D/E)XK nuclease family protein [Cytophagales bacterium]
MKLLWEQVLEDWQTQSANDFSTRQLIVPTFHMLSSWNSFARDSLGKENQAKAFALPLVQTMDAFLSEIANEKLIPYPLPEEENEEEEEDLPNILVLLHQTCQEIMPKDFVWSKEGLRALPLSENILRHFDEIDKALISPEKIFLHISEYKDLEKDIPELGEEARKIIRNFWKEHSKNISRWEKNQNFTSIWNKLSDIYKGFQEKLDKHNLSYRGRIYKLASKNLPPSGTYPYQVSFAGFSAMNPVEEKVLKHFIQHQKAQIYWHLHDHYMQDSQHAGGYFPRQYKRDKVFSPSFPGSYLSVQNKKTHVMECPSPHGQIRQVSQKLAALSDQEWSETSVVLPDSSRLFSLLYYLPLQDRQVRIRLSCPLRHTPLASLIELWCKLAEDPNKNLYRLKESLFTHPYLSYFPLGKDKTAESITQRWCDFLEIRRTNKTEPKDLLTFIQKLNKLYSKQNQGRKSVWAPTAVLNSSVLQSFQSLLESELDLTSELKLLEGLCLKDKLDFIRNLLEGSVSISEDIGNSSDQPLQIGSVEYTQAFPNPNLFVLDLNEDIWPKGISAIPPLIPYNLRKPYDLPVLQDINAIYTHFFYQVLAQSKTAHLYYVRSTQTHHGTINRKEKSRYISQLLYDKPNEYPQPILLPYPSLNSPSKHPPINLAKEKTPEDEKAIERVLKGQQEDDNEEKGISVSTLLDLLACPLCFYYKYILKVYDPVIISEEGAIPTMDRAQIGHLLHTILEKLYKDLEGKEVQERDLTDLEKKFPKLMEELTKKFCEEEKDKHPLEKEKFDYPFKGPNILIPDLLKRRIKTLIDWDKKQVPFRILSLEKEVGKEKDWKIQLDDRRSIRIRGRIDRISQKGNTIHVVDYKSGKKNNNQNIIPSDSPFSAENIHEHREALQVLLYSLIYSQSYASPTEKVMPELLFLGSLKSDQESYLKIQEIESGKKIPCQDAKILRDLIENDLRTRLQAFLKETHFKPTDLKDTSKCPFPDLCKKDQ